MSWVRRLQAGLTHASRMLNSGALPPLDKAPERSLASALPAALFPALRPFATQPDKPGSEGAGTQQPKHESSDASGSKPSGRVNPVEEQVRMLLDAYSASGVVVERSMEDPRLGWQRAIEEGVGSWLVSGDACALLICYQVSPSPKK